MNEDDYLMISGIQHFAFCKRQWALIHIENQWFENEYTTDGEIFHERAHDSSLIEKRKGIIITRALRIKSDTLGVTGSCDIVEFHKDDDGISIHNFEGKWLPIPIEYKRGKPKQYNYDELQLCTEAMCLEEMLVCKIEYGFIYYGETGKRKKIIFDDTLKNQVKSLFQEMHELFNKAHTPKVKTNKRCYLCSLKNICLPKLNKIKQASTYINNILEEKHEETT